MPAEKRTTLQGLDLKIGGEGMKGFYDRMIPSFLNKYGKKWGARVGSVDINLGGEMEATPAIQITDAMKESVLYEGQPLFSVRKGVREAGWTENNPNQTEAQKPTKKTSSSGVCQPKAEINSPE